MALRSCYGKYFSCITRYLNVKNQNLDVGIIVNVHVLCPENCAVQ